MSSGPTGFNVAFIGLGAMGIPMARRLIESGLTVHGYDTNPTATATLKEAGGTASASPAQAAANASIVLLMVAAAEDVTSALFAPKIGAVYGLSENATIILHSTVPPTLPQEVRHRLDSDHRRGDVVVMDAPVLGSTKNAEDGTLDAMISAAKAEHLEHAEVKLILTVIAQNVYHIAGPLGSALKVNLLHQVLCGIHLVAAVEISSVTAVVGLDTKRFCEKVADTGAKRESKRSCWSWMFEDRIPKLLRETLPVHSAMSAMLKDVRIVNGEAENAGLQLRLCKASQVVYEKSVNLGFGGDEDSAIVGAYLRRETSSGSERKKIFQTISEMGGMFPEDEAIQLEGLLEDALAAIHAMAAYEALVFAEGTHLCRTLKQCRQWIDILGGGAAASTVVIKGMPRMFESETHGTGSLELLVPRREGILESLVSRHL